MLFWELNNQVQFQILMKKIILIHLLLLMVFPCIQAQITVTKAVFPEVGDLYYTSRDTATPGVMITPDGPNQTWVFDNFIPRFADTTNIIAASQGSVAADYPEADVIVPYLGGEGYADTSGDSVTVIGFFGDGGFGFGSGFNVNLDPDLVALAVPLDYGQSFTDDFGFNLEFDPSNFPQLQMLLDSLVPAGVTIDSIRITYNSVRTSEVDAWGQLTTGHGTFDVLRVERLEYNETNFEVKPSFPPVWIDPSTLGVAIPFAGIDTTLVYDFVNDVAKTQIMTVSVDDITGDILSVNYKIDPSEVVPIVMSSVEHTIEEGFSINAYPNPAFVEVNFTVSNVPSGQYTLNIYNLLGRKLLSRQLLLNGQHLEKLDVSNFPKGSYIYNIVNEDGETLATKRLVVVKP